MKLLIVIKKGGEIMKKGFTLIELLAVIVILAIIALIATPIILGIINDARKESNERSVELYASAVRNAIASYQLTHPTAPTKFSDLDVQYDGDVVCETEELYANGSFYIADCKANGTLVEGYTYGTQQITEETGSLSYVCDPVNVATEGTYTMGDEYTCEVKEGTSYTFYVLSTTETSVNLIMDSNVRSDGTPVKDTTNLGLVAWYADDMDNSYGPTTAMTYLQTATSSWTNVNAQTISTFTDDAGETHEMAQTFTANARLPYLSEVEGTGCEQYSDGTCPLWMTNYLHANTTYYPERTAVSGVYGYWMLSSRASYSNTAWSVLFNGYAIFDDVSTGVYYGVRPVINLSI